MRLAPLLILVVLVASRARGADNGHLAIEPLAPRSPAVGTTLFHERPSAETGVVTENPYTDPRIWGERYNEFSVGAIGTGLAVGDYDGDGRPDLFVVSKDGPCRLFRNLGGWKFEDVTAQAGLAQVGATPGVWRQGAAFADVNNDGRLDLYLCCWGGPNLLFINQGDGTFHEEAAARGLALNDASGMAAFCDYDRDGWLDVYVQTNVLDTVAHPDGQRDHLYHNRGDGTFEDVTGKALQVAETHGHSAIWWDYDGDGWPDLYVANDFAAPDVLYHNRHDGTFTEVLADVMPCQPYHAMGSDIGDVNNDGRMDLFVGEMARRTHEGDYRTIAETRTRPDEEAMNRLGAPPYMRNMLFVNTGRGRFVEAAQLAGIAATNWTWSPRFEDFDNDGRVDLFVTTGMVREYDNVDLRTRTMLAEVPSERVRIVRSSPEEREANLAFRNLGDLRFEEVGKAWGLDRVGVSFGSATADFDGDGDLDLAFANYQGGVTLMENESQTGHRLVVALRGHRSNRFGIGATIRIETRTGRQVRYLTLARGYLSTSEPVAQFGLGDDTTIDRLTVEWPSGAVQKFTDLPADRRLVIDEPATTSVPVEQRALAPSLFVDATQAAGLALTSRAAAVGEPQRATFLPFRFNARGPALAVGDLGDGRMDVVLGGTTLDPLRVVRANGRGGFAPPMALADHLEVNDGPLLVFDADGDGRNDVLETKAGVTAFAGSEAFQPVLWWNRAGGFERAPAGVLPKFPVYVGAAAAADFDRDGHLDVFLGGRLQVGRYPTPPRSALWANRDGKFVDVTDTLAPGLRQVGMVTSALWTDVDGDGWPDLLVATEWGHVSYWHNHAGRGFDDETERAGFAAAGTGWWTALAEADLNEDGRPDYIAGNVGLNTRYRADAVHPALLYEGRFGERGPPLLLEGYYEGENVYPWLTRRELGAKMPDVLRRFPTNDGYARATLPEIVGADRLAGAARFAATELRSGVFLSQPDGRYRFVPLPRWVQLAPVQGVVTGDFDGDGHMDVAVAQNSYAPIYTVGRFCGGVGVVLRGDGAGGLTPLAPAESGVVIPGDAKAMIATDLNDDGWPDLVVSRADAATMVWRNEGTPGRTRLTVRLRGPAGNPSAIGARVTVRFGDGATRMLETHAGEGYLSQSALLSLGVFPGHEPREIAIRWPDGTETRQAVLPNARDVTVGPGK